MSHPEKPTPRQEGASHPFEDRRDKILEHIAGVRKDLENDSGPHEEETITLSNGDKVVIGGEDEIDATKSLIAELDQLVEMVQKVEPTDDDAEEVLQQAEETISHIIDELDSDPTEEDFF